ncbi:MAG: sigma-70 family RNA polymerase sigma factor [Sandaracinaceae bacterium]|nr:sigma-70 family RNA polymerase sigma factor [Sandaracinaceae bacterium]
MLLMRMPPSPRPSAATQSESTVEIRAREATSLVEAARTGDPRAFDELVKRYRPRIFALALHMTGSRSDADDITQDAFLRAYNKLAEFEGRSEFFTWLYRIALHRALNVQRDRRRRPAVDFEDPRVGMAVAVDSGGDPRRSAELREQYAHLLHALDRLSPILRTTVVLTTLQDLSYNEAAVILGTNEGTIAWRIHEARSQLKKILDAYSRGDPTPILEPRASRKPVATPAPDDAVATSVEQMLAMMRPA